MGTDCKALQDREEGCVEQEIAMCAWETAYYMDV